MIAEWQPRWDPLDAIGFPYRARFAARPDVWGPKLDGILADVFGPPPTPLPEGVESVDALTFVTVERLARDARRLMDRLDPDVDLVVGISRSGLLPGALIAYHLHAPLMAVSRQAGVTDPGHGFRMEGRDRRPARHVLIIDDTIASGREMRACAPIVAAAFPGARLTRAVVYAIPEVAPGVVDLYATAYPGPHYLEWNWQNAGHGSACGYDFDGILVRDDDPQQRPLYLPRRTPIPLVCTGRHESARSLTQDWLDRWGVRCERLVMRDFGAPLEFDVGAIASFKARVYAESGLPLFAESDPAQAQQIARESGKPVLCPAAGRVIAPPVAAAPAPRPASPAVHAAAVKARACPDRDDSGCGCNKARCRRDDRIVYLSDCRACIEREERVA